MLRFFKVIWSLVVIAVCLLGLPKLAIAQTAQDFSQLSFSQLPPVQSNGSLQAGGISRSWQAGQTPDQFMRLGDVQTLQPQSMSIDTISQVINQSLANASIASFQPLAEQSVNNLLNAAPGLGQLPVADLPALERLFGTRAGNVVNADTLQAGSLGQVVGQFPQLGDLKLNAIDMNQFAINSLPGISATPIGQLPGWQNAPINGVPGLNQVPLGSFPGGLGGLLGGATMRIDFVHGPEEAKRLNTISGSDVEGFRVPCKIGRKDCAYIELDDTENQGDSAQSKAEGVQWISGKYQEVKGGRGALAMVNGGKEPTGRLPYGDVFKVVIWEPDETTDTVTSALFTRFCRDPMNCTPYFIGPIPHLTYKRDSNIFVGQLDLSTPPNTSSTPTGAKKGGGMPAMATFDGAGGFGGGEGGGELCGTGPGGVDWSALTDAITSIESQGHEGGVGGLYGTVGVPNCDSGGCYVPMGRYQLMSFREDARAAISKNPGGSAFLSKIDGGYTPSRAEMAQYFPAASQDAVFKAAMTEEISRQQARGLSGDALIGCLGQAWYAGSCTNGSNRDYIGGPTVSEYGQRAISAYRASLAKGGGKQCTTASGGGAGGTPGDGKARGNFVNPGQGYAVTSEFGPRSSPCAGCSSNHGGIDFGMPAGTPVKSADGGRVVYAGPADGYGQVVIVDHGNGLQTRYAHVNSFNVREGQTVSQGQVLAQSGSTGVGTGAHLHFEVRTGASPGNPFSGQAQNPRNYLRGL